jgi:hypothetical protein
VWNEPQFPQNGGWEPEALARYANDCARALHEAGLPVKVGVPLHMGDTHWNERLCAALDIEDGPCTAPSGTFTHPLIGPRSTPRETWPPLCTLSVR